MLHIPALWYFGTSVTYPPWFRRVKLVVIPPRFIWQQYLWNIVIQPTVGCYNSWANLRSCYPLGEKLLWNRSIDYCPVVFFFFLILGWGRCLCGLMWMGVGGGMGWGWGKGGGGCFAWSECNLVIEYVLLNFLAVWPPAWTFSYPHISNILHFN